MIIMTNCGFFDQSTISWSGFKEHAPPATPSAFLNIARKARASSLSAWRICSADGSTSGTISGSCAGFRCRNFSQLQSTGPILTQCFYRGLLM